MKKLLISLFVALSLLGVTSVPVSANAASPLTQFAACAGSRILTFPTWYRGLTQDANCNIQLNDLSQIWLIALNIIEIGMQVAGYIAIGFLIWGGIQYIKSQGEPSNLTQAKNTILNAVVGLGLVLASVGIVNFIASRFSG